jgi:hypothetical protein
VQAGPVCEGMGSDVSAEEVLAVDCGGYVGKDGLDVAFDSILLLLVWGGALVAVLVVFVELIRLS